MHRNRSPVFHDHGEEHDKDNSVSEDGSGTDHSFEMLMARDNHVERDGMRSRSRSPSLELNVLPQSESRKRKERRDRWHFTDRSI